jgi:hypothetical protein
MPKKARDVELENFWRQVHERQKASGMGVVAFCKAEGLQDHRFWYWGREFRKLDDATKAKAAKSKSAARAVRPKVVAKTTHIESPAAKDPKEPGEDFAPVRLVDDESPAPATKSKEEPSNTAEIVLKGGRSIRISSDCSVNFLKTLISALEGG